MNFCFAAGIYPPEVGGPSIYAEKLKGAIEESGHSVRVVTYGQIKKFPSGIRHVLYAIKLLLRATHADVVIAFDTYSVGLPAAVACLILRKPLIIRIGGDFLWEQYVERTHDMVPLPDFYAQNLPLSTKERIVRRMTAWVLRQGVAVFSTAWLRDMWVAAYELPSEMTAVIENSIPARESAAAAESRNFLMFGRQIALKNADAFRRAFNRAKEKDSSIQLEEGIIPHDELMSRMRTCYAVVVPSLSEVSPNTVLEALRYGKPFLLTKYSGYADLLNGFGVFVDPLDEDDMARGVEQLADDATYAALKDRMRAFTNVRGYDAIAKEFIGIASKFV